MRDKNSVIVIGTGLLFTDENGKIFLISCHNLMASEYDKVLFSKGIRQIGCKNELSDSDREKIISKIVELTPQTKLLIK